MLAAAKAARLLGDRRAIPLQSALKKSLRIAELRIF
jgi:hypothetical protein